MGFVTDFLKDSGGSLLSAGITSLVSGLGNRAQIKAQAKENQKNREYNLMLARLQNQWNLEQWQRENDYNSPTAQMARYRAAGLNPDLIYGQQNTSAASPELTSGAPAAVQDMSPMGEMYRSFGNFMQNYMNLEQQKAAIKNLNSNTEKTDEERAGIELDNILKKETLPNNIRLSGITVEGAQVLNDLNKEKRNEIVAKIPNIVQNTRESQARVEYLNSLVSKIEFDKQQDAKRLINETLRNSAEIKKLQSETALNENTLMEAISTFSFRLVGLTTTNEKLSNESKLLVEQFELIHTQAEQAKFDLQYDKDYKLIFDAVDAVSKVLGTSSSSFNSIVDILMKLSGKGKAPSPYKPTPYVKGYAPRY